MTGNSKGRSPWKNGTTVYVTGSAAPKPVNTRQNQLSPQSNHQNVQPNHPYSQPNDTNAQSAEYDFPPRSWQDHFADGARPSPPLPPRRGPIPIRKYLKCVACSHESEISEGYMICPICLVKNTDADATPGSSHGLINSTEIARILQAIKAQGFDTQDAAPQSQDMASTIFGSTFALSFAFQMEYDPTKLNANSLSDFSKCIQMSTKFKSKITDLAWKLLFDPGKQPTEYVLWLLVLLHIPIWSSSTSSAFSVLVGIISNLQLSQQKTLSIFLSQISRASFGSIIDSIVSFIGKKVVLGSYSTDWSVQSACKVGAMLFALVRQRKVDRIEYNRFYCSILDTLGPAVLLEDFHRWQDRSSSFTLCQYPFLFSLAVKSELVKYDNEQAMEAAEREVIRNHDFNRPLVPHVVIQVRRSHLLSDSLSQISSNYENLRKRLKVVFVGEEGIDAGGVSKEWLLLLTRQLFDPQYGMFVYDPDTHYAYFNPASIEEEFTDSYFLIGGILGLSIYHNITLDIPLSPVLFRILQNDPIGFPDLQKLFPQVSKGLQQLLEYEEQQGKESVEDLFCRSFVGEYEAWGEVITVPLIKNGELIAVTSDNREEFVKLYTDFLLTTSVTKQLTAFSEGFKQVSASNAFSLLRGEELELLIRGSEETINVDDLKAVSRYEGFYGPTDPTIVLFWEAVTSFSQQEQKKLLAFITASDRIPATGTTSLRLRITCMGSKIEKYPVSHTCFNQLCLWRYPTLEMMQQKLRMAMNESEGFTLR